MNCLLMVIVGFCFTFANPFLDYVLYLPQHILVIAPNKLISFANLLLIKPDDVLYTFHSA